MKLPTRVLPDGSIIQVYDLTFNRARLGITRTPAEDNFTFDDEW